MDKYPYFLNYDDPSEIPFKRLAEKLGVHPNVLRAMMRSARSNDTIYAALRKVGYGDHQIPSWFARPDEPPVRLRVATAGPGVNAEERSDAEVRSESNTGYKLPAINVVQEKNAERPSGLSLRSAPPAFVYGLAQPTYQPPLNPILEEAFQLLKENQEMEMRASLERIKRRQDPKFTTLEEIKAIAEVYNIRQQIEAGNAAKMMFLMNMKLPRKTSKPLDKRAITELFTKPFEEMRARKGAKGTDSGWIDTIEVVGQLLKNCTPNIVSGGDFFQRYEAAIQEKCDNDREALVDLAKLLVEKRKRKNFHIQLLEKQNRDIMENFWKARG